MDAGPGPGWQGFHESLESYRSFLLVSHLCPEGDSLGSEVALARHLRERGKKVHVLNPTSPRPCYDFLLGLYPIHHLGDPVGGEIPAHVEAVVALDVGQWDYLGPLGPILRGAGLPILVLDHHQPSADFGDLSVVDCGAASTGELIYHYLRWAGARITPTIAQALYASLLFDTGGLRLPQTTNRAVLVAADLVRHGADHQAVSRFILQNETFERIDLYRRSLETMQIELGGRFVWMSIPQQLFLDTGTSLSDGDGILDNLLMVHGVELCALFREVSGFGCRATFRSCGLHDVAPLAASLGGGGRPCASGVFLPLSMGEARDLILPMARELIDAGQPFEVPPTAFSTAIDPP